MTSWLRSNPRADGATARGATSSNLWMKRIEVISQKPDLDQTTARAIADATVRSHVEDAILLSWYDRDNDFESPAHASECHDACDEPGYLEYARSRGAAVRVDVDGGRFVFCYRPLGEFADAL